MSLAVLSFPYYTSRASLELFTLLVVSTLNIMFFTQPRHQQDPLLEAKNSGHGKINTSSLLLFLTFSLFHLQQLHPVLPTVRHIQKHKHHPVSSSNNSSSQPHTQTHHEQHSKVPLSFVYVSKASCDLHLFFHWGNEIQTTNLLLPLVLFQAGRS